VTEADWDSCADPDVMLAHLRDNASARKLRVFACACVRRIWHLIGEPRATEAIELAEWFADGLAGTTALGRARAGVEAALRESPLWGMLDADADLEAAAGAVDEDAWRAARAAAWNAAWHPPFMAEDGGLARRGIALDAPLGTFDEERRRAHAPGYERGKVDSER
jgi:hypothetical protein